MVVETLKTPESSRIIQMEYVENVPGQGILTIYFRDKKQSVYEYHGVPRMIWGKLWFAESKGKAFEELIKHSDYKCVKVRK